MGEPIRCAHCLLSVPEELVHPDGKESFCCSGCETVYHLLQGAGLTDYYAFRDRLGEATRPVEGRTDVLDELDSAAFTELYCSELPSGHLKTQLLLEGVHCAACLWLIEKLPRLEPAVASARLEMSRSRLEIEWDPAQARLGEIGRTLSQMGYRPRPYRASAADELRRSELRSLLVRIGVAGASAGNVMLMAFALYSGAVGIDEAETMNLTTRRFFELASFVVSLPALWAGGLFFRGAWASVRTKTPHMDLPIAIGIFVGFVWGAISALRGGGEIYFDSITALIFFLLLGRYVQRRHQMAVSDAAELVHSIIPGTALILESTAEQPSEECERRVSSGALLPGQVVIVQSGEVLPVDGRIIQGDSSLDKSLLSGESHPIDVGVGDLVEAGALNLGSRILVCAEKSGTETRVARLMKQVEQALMTRSPLVSRADRMAGSFTVVVLGLALVVGVFWGLRSPELGVENALSLLIVACPCALGMATPLALSAAVRQAARQGQLVFSADALERLGTPSILVLDKTGTLTEGVMRVLEWEGDETVASLVLACERGATHPVALALVKYLEQKLEANPLSVIPASVTEKLGCGREATIGGRKVIVGSPGYVSRVARTGDQFENSLRSNQARGTPVLVAIDNEVCSLIWLGDAIREDAAASLLQARKMGHRLHLLSGDHEGTVHNVARILSQTSGCVDLFESVRGGVTPEQKLEAIRALRADSRPVVMVGDGVNDSGALAQADVGVAVSGAAEASRLSADVFLSQSGVSSLVLLLSGAQKTIATVRRGIAFSLVYNAIGISCAALGILGPLGAAILMPLSSLTVITNAYRSRTFAQTIAQRRVAATWGAN